jgi:anaerobic selenocysteine-containing dehydrogenase
LLKYTLNGNSFNINSNIGTINFLYGENLFSNYNLMESNFIFLEALDESLFINKLKNYNNFIVYHGSFFDISAKYANLIFPSLTFFEDIYKCVNYQGFLRKTNLVVKTSYDILSNTEFFKVLIFFNKNISKNKLNFSKCLKYFKFLNVNFHFNLYKDYGVLNYNYFNKILLENVIFTSSIYNFYKTDYYSRNSKNLHLASMEYMKTVNIFNK